MEVHNLEFKIRIGILIIIVSLIGNLVYFQSKQLEEPVFLKHYCELPLLEDGNTKMELYYLKNSSDNLKITDIYFPKLKDKKYYVLGELTNSISPHYNIQKLSVFFDKSIFDSIDENLILENAVVTLNNGSRMEVDLGKIIFIKTEKVDSTLELYSGTHHDIDPNPLDNIDFYMNFNIDYDPYYGTGFYLNESAVTEPVSIYKAYAPVTINSITTSLSDESIGLVDIGVQIDYPADTSYTERKGVRIYSPKKLNHSDSVAMENLNLPLKVEKTLNISTKFNIEDQTKQFNVYKLLYSINYTTETGENESTYLYGVKYIPYLHDGKITDFLESRGL